MASRRDSSSKRLIQLFEERRLLPGLAERFFEEGFLIPAGTSFDQLIDFKNEIVHAACSRIALRLNTTLQKDAPLLAAFEEAGLNHQNPLHWRALLAMFAEVHFGKKKTNTQIWDVVGLFQVFADYTTIRREDPSATETGIARKLRSDKRFKEKYGHYNEHALRKLLRQAKSPKTNVLLRHPEMADPLLQVIRDDYEKKSIQWTPELEAQLRKIIERFFAAIEQKVS
jgi:hypothetical protein